MNLLILKKFNNYFNRKIKRYSTLSDYQSASASYTSLTSINFNPADGVRTELILGKGELNAFMDFEKTDTPDYLICYTTTVTPGQNEGDPEIVTNTIESRWFVTDVDRTRGGQYKIKLKRDSIADNFDALLSCPAYIKKGMVSDDNPLILNDEGLSLNQIKSGETLLKDGTGSAWLVGYMPKNGGTDGNVSVQIPTQNITYETIEELATELGISSSVLSSMLTTTQNNPSYFVNDNIELVAWLNIPDSKPTENQVIAGSQNFLSSFTYSSEAVKNHNATSDCVGLWHNYWTTYPYGTQVTKRIKNYWLEAATHYKANIVSSWQSWTGHPLLSKSVYNKLLQLATNQTLIYKAGTYYTIKSGAASGPTNVGELYPVNKTDPTVANMVNRMITRWNSDYPTHNLEAVTGGRIFVNYNELVCSFYLEKVTDLGTIPGVTFTMSSTRNACADQVYDMFAIPFDNINIINGGETLEGIGEYSQQLAVAIAEKMSAGSYDLYDLQLLPYCPISDYVSDGSLTLTNLAAGYDYDYISQTGTTVAGSQDVWGTLNEYAPGQYEAEFIVDTGVASADFISKDAIILQNDSMTPNIQLNSSTSVVNNQVRISYYGQVNNVQDPDHIQVRVSWTYTSHDPVHKSVVIYPKKASFNVNINKSLSLKDSMKIEALCNNYRLVSPNYQGSFDFNLAKNRGSCSGFIAECTYKPYTPYIKVAPIFDWMYGTNFGDCRGLICGGDFSLGRVNSAWQQYQLENKNYQNIFNREIQNLDIQQGITRTQQYAAGGIGILTAGLTGATTGAIAGSKMGGGYGAAIGAAIGGVTTAGASAAGYGVDMSLMEKGMIEQRQFAIDKFKLQLGNVQAIPYTITKVGSFDINSKIWPFLEYYTCTDEEKTYLANKIQYEGMSIGVVDLLSNYIAQEGSGNYLQADLIRNEDITDDNHQLEDIYLELSKGVYL